MPFIRARYDSVTTRPRTRSRISNASRHSSSRGRITPRQYALMWATCSRPFPSRSGTSRSPASVLPLSFVPTWNATHAVCSLAAAMTPAVESGVNGW